MTTDLTFAAHRLRRACGALRSDPAGAPGSAWQGCRDVALTSGPWWPFPETVVMSERPTLLTLDGRDRLHAETGQLFNGATGTTWGRVAGFSSTHVARGRRRAGHDLRRSQ
ncbi:DUF6745 domain-containing protein [Micromonospora parva]|uniref:DUF6745 domain-containing protein n=1 Tax=Micromonospora parva TaxID=1464048 RepID=UPI0037162D13